MQKRTSKHHQRQSINVSGGDQQHQRLSNHVPFYEDGIFVQDTDADIIEIESLMKHSEEDADYDKLVKESLLDK